MRRLPRSLRLDASDLSVFHRAAAPGEWAVTGSFTFAGGDPSGWDNKEQLAFKSGWLGCGSFGHSTLVEVAEIEEADFFQVIERLARHFVDCYGAPDLASALPAARAEAEDAASLCDHKLHTLLALEREFNAEGIVERVKVVEPARAADHARIWEVAADD